MKKVVILWPRMDATFKEGFVPPSAPSRRYRTHDLPEIRQHWVRFLRRLEDWHIDQGDDVQVIYKPLWQMVPQDVPNCDVCYVPHRLPETFPVETADRTFYYMQTVLPWLFTVSELGWGARIKKELFDRARLAASPVGLLNKLRNRQLDGASKFAQAKRATYPHDNYALFVCQLPHDDTIRYFSEISVLDALAEASELCIKAKVPLVVKGHIANPSSQKAFHEFATSKGHAWEMEGWNILDLMQNAKVVMSVNSGSMIEALIMGKHVMTWGDSEYEPVSYNVRFRAPSSTVDRLRCWTCRDCDQLGGIKLDWLQTWYSYCHSAETGEQFMKVPHL